MATAAAYYVTGITVKAVIRNNSRKFIDVTDLENLVYENYDDTNLAAYAIDCTEEGNTAEYYCTWPSNLAIGQYAIQFIPLAGGTIAETDFPNRFAAQSYYWSGSILIGVVIGDTSVEGENQTVE